MLAQNILPICFPVKNIHLLRITKKKLLIPNITYYYILKKHVKVFFLIIILQTFNHVQWRSREL